MQTRNSAAKAVKRKISIKKNADPAAALRRQLRLLQSEQDLLGKVSDFIDTLDMGGFSPIPSPARSLIDDFEEKIFNHMVDNCETGWRLQRQLGNYII